MVLSSAADATVEWPPHRSKWSTLEGQSGDQGAEHKANGKGVRGLTLKSKEGAVETKVKLIPVSLPNLDTIKLKYRAYLIYELNKLILSSPTRVLFL